MPRPSSRIFLRDTIILFFGVLAATGLLTGIEAESTLTLILVALVLAALNVILKPLLVFFTLPFVIFTFGLGILLINALLLLLAGQLVPGFTVPTFGTAFLGSLIISFIAMAVNLFLTPRPNIHITRKQSGSHSAHRRRQTLSRRDVIDV
jgi:putative membrane protein